MEILGYKCFNKELMNRYGIKFNVGQIYVAAGILKFGKNGNGFHMCKNIEDTFRYYDTKNNSICICEVIGGGKYIEYSDEYNEYFDMYCVEKLQIVKELTREEIIETGLNLNEVRAKRFVSTLSLSSDEIELFKKKFKKKQSILDAIAYYQENDKKVYEKKFNAQKYIKQLYKKLNGNK